MCGRYAASATTAELVEEFGAPATPDATMSLLKSAQQPPVGTPDYNLSPGKKAPVIVQRTGSGARELRWLSWGLVPGWSKSAQHSYRMINARAETVAASRAFAPALAARRCLVPADGWYEWQASPTARDPSGKPRKQPFFIHREDGARVAFAGVYEFFRGPAQWLITFAIITTVAAPGLDRIHQRAPLVVAPNEYQAWLEPTATDAARLIPLLEPSPASWFAAHPVGRAVGNSQANGPALIAPIPLEELRAAVDPRTGEVLGNPE